MSLQVCIDQILKPVVKPWLLEKQDFVLEEDGDSWYDKAKNCNIVTNWEEENNIEYFFNCASFPDFSPIENCRQPLKQHLKKYPHSDGRTINQLIVEGWDLVSQRYINEKCRSIPKRLRAVNKAEGDMDQRGVCAQILVFHFSKSEYVTDQYWSGIFSLLVLGN